jgi:hypothetical protein
MPTENEFYIIVNVVLIDFVLVLLIIETIKKNENGSN